MDQPTPDQLAIQENQSQSNVLPSPNTNDVKTGFDSYGISGLTRYGAVSRVYEEFLRELQGPAGMKNYREMRDNDPVIGAILFAANHLCRRVSYKVKAANQTQEAQWVAKKIGSMLFDDLGSTWPDTMSEILTMLPFGWALLEMRLKRRLGGLETPTSDALPEQNTQISGGIGYPSPEFVPSRFNDGLIGFRSWSLRSQETLFMWEFDEESNAIVMQQMAPPDYKIRRIPLAKCLLFRTQVAKNNPEGFSIIRNAWTSYYLKKNLQVFEGIGIERDLAGYPMITTCEPDATKGIQPPDLWNSKNPEMVALLGTLKQLVRSVRRDEQEGMVLPYWAKFSLVSTGSRRAFDTNTIISRYDQRIAQSVLADFVMLGHEAVGSKAMAATKISLFTSALSSFLDSACAIINRHAITLLMQVNGWAEELTPILEHGEVESVNLMELGTFIKDIVGTGFNPLASPEAQAAVMQAAKLTIVPNEIEDETMLTETVPTLEGPLELQITKNFTDQLGKLEKLATDIESLKDLIKNSVQEIHMHAAPVHVASPNVEIHPADIHVPVTITPSDTHVHVDAPNISVVTPEGEKKLMKRIVQRDKDGRIIGTIDEAVE